MDLLIPEKLTLEKDDLLGFMTISAFSQREAWINKGMFAFVSWKWVNPLAEWIGDKNVLEVMAGAGWLAKALREKGIKIIATDDYSWVKEKKWEIVSPVEELGAVEAIKKYGAGCNVLIMSWPYMDEAAYKAIKQLNKVNPDCFIIYIGEPGGGCTASDNFFNHFEVIDDDARFNEISKNYEAWPGLHDRIFLGKVKPQK